VVSVAKSSDAQARAGAFATRYRGALASIDGAGLVEAMSALAEIYDLVGRAVDARQGAPVARRECAGPRLRVVEQRRHRALAGECDQVREVPADLLG
jgi:hypothetical protein